MRTPFTDITIYSPTPYTVGTLEYLEESSLINFVSDLYVQNMNGYKPPKTSRITIQPGYHDIWEKPWKNGSIVSIAPFFNHEEFIVLNKPDKYKYILDLIQSSTIELSNEYQWDKSIFENAYNKILNSNFNFRIEYPAKQSKDKKKKGTLIITKTETVTSVYVEIDIDGIITSQKLFDKKNTWCYDCAYVLARNSKWFDNNRYGFSFGKGKINAWYSLDEKTVELYESEQKAAEIDFKKHFLFG